jgi:IS605 OrfB family transposase
MQLRYNYRLDPRPRHRLAFGKAFGCARVVFNDALAARQAAHAAGQPFISDADLSARLTAAKTAPQRAWLGEVSAVILQQSLADLTTAYRRFFESRKALRQWRAAGRKGPKPRAVEFHHQLSTALIRDNQAVAVENLAVNGLARTRLAKSVHDAGWSAFTGMLEYKARLYGREFHRIGRFEPTSQVCSACGVKDGPKPLHVRTWQCQACRAWLDRDINAAVNVAKAAGLAVTACRAQVRPGPRVPAQRSEAGTHPKPRREAAWQARISALQLQDGVEVNCRA